MTISTPYTKRELDEKFEDVRTQFTEVKDTLIEIKIQTQKTNGRVGSLENYKWFLLGMGCIITVLLIPILIALIQSGKI